MAGPEGTTRGDPTSRAVDRTSALPLWAQIYDDLRRRLDAGAFTDAFPGELSLVREYGVSRHTVREALRKLRSEGLVTAERGRSPMPVQPAEIEQPLGTLYSLFASVEAAGHTQHSVVMALDIRADGVVTTRLGLEESTPLLYLARLRLADSEPLAIDRVWLPASIAAPLLEADFANTALYHELDTRCGTRLSRGHERLRAVIPTPAEQELLDMPEGTAAFAIDRLAYSVDRAVEWRQTLVRGDRFGVTSGFSARSGHLIVTGGRDTNNENGPSALLLS